MFSDGLIVTLVADLNVSEADGRYVTLLSGWGASVVVVLKESAGVTSGRKSACWVRSRVVSRGCC